MLCRQCTGRVSGCFEIRSNLHFRRVRVLVQILRERVALGRKLAEAIAAALPTRRMEAIAAVPLGQRSRRAKAEPDAEPRATTPKPAGKPVMTGCTRSRLPEPFLGVVKRYQNARG